MNPRAKGKRIFAYYQVGYTALNPDGYHRNYCATVGVVIDAGHSGKGLHAQAEENFRQWANETNIRLTSINSVTFD